MADKIRVLHVVGALRGGGIQRFLLDVLRFRNAKRFDMDVCVMSNEVGELGAEAQGFGAKIHRCPLRSSPFTFSRRLGRIIQDGGYSAVHAHRSSMMMMFPLSVAHSLNVPRRIAHFHSVHLGRSLSPRDMAAPMLRKRLLRHATDIAGVSSWVLDTHFGKSWRDNPSCQVLHGGIDCEAFLAPQDRAAARAELGLADDAKVIGHVARFSEAKNHAAILEIAQALCKKDQSVRFVLVGDGPLRDRIETRAREMGLQDKIVFAGWRSNIPSVLSAFDVFLFPSRWEGLGLVLLEAQAAGLPCITSDIPPFEEALHPDLRALRFSLESPLDALKGIEFLLGRPEERKRLGAAGREFSRRFDIRTVGRRIERLYEETQ